MSPRRVGCLLFGLVWAGIFVATNYVLALGDPTPVDCTGIAYCDPYPARWTDHILLIELGILLVGAAIFYRAEMKRGDF